MSNKTNWVEVDKRIRARRTSWTAEDKKALENGLKKLPDLAEEVEVIDIQQPALAGPPEEDGEPIDEAPPAAGS